MKKPAVPWHRMWICCIYLYLEQLECPVFSDIIFACWDMNHETFLSCFKLHSWFEAFFAFAFGFVPSAKRHIFWQCSALVLSFSQLCLSLCACWGSASSHIQHDIYSKSHVVNAVRQLSYQSIQIHIKIVRNCFYKSFGV